MAIALLMLSFIGKIEIAIILQSVLSFQGYYPKSVLNIDF